MAAVNESLGTLTIASGGTDSSKLTPQGGKVAFDTLISMLIYAPAALTGTVTIQVSHLQSPTTEYVTLVDAAGDDITIAAAKAVQVSCGGIKAMRLHSSGAEGADRVFNLVGQLSVT